MEHSCKHQGSFVRETTHHILDTGHKYHPYTTEDRNWTESPRRESTSRQPFSRAMEPPNTDSHTNSKPDTTQARQEGTSSSFSREYQISAAATASTPVLHSEINLAMTNASESRSIIRKVKEAKDFSANFDITQEQERVVLLVYPNKTEGTQTPQQDDTAANSLSQSAIKFNDRQQYLKLMNSKEPKPTKLLSSSTQTDASVYSPAEQNLKKQVQEIPSHQTHMVFLQDEQGMTAGPLLFSQKPKSENHSSISHLGEIHILQVSSDNDLAITQVHMLKELLLTTLLQGKSLKLLINPSVSENLSQPSDSNSKEDKPTPQPKKEEKEPKMNDADTKAIQSKSQADSNTIQDDINVFYASLGQRMKKLEEENIALKKLLMKDTGTDAMTTRPVVTEEPLITKIEEEPIKARELNRSSKSSRPSNDIYLSPKDSNGLYEMLQEFMVENESLRQDNARLLRGKEDMESEHQKVICESLSLAQRLESMEKQVLPLLKQMETESKLKSQSKQILVPPSFLHDSAIFPNEYFDPHRIGNPLAPPQPLHHPMQPNLLQQIPPFTPFNDINNDLRLFHGQRRLPPVSQQEVPPKDTPSSQAYQASSPSLTRSRLPSHVQPSPPPLPMPTNATSNSNVVYGPSSKQRLPPSGIPFNSQAPKNSSYREKYFPSSQAMQQSPANGNAKYATIDQHGNIVNSYTTNFAPETNDFQGRQENRFQESGARAVKTKPKRWNL